MITIDDFSFQYLSLYSSSLKSIIIIDVVFGMQLKVSSFSDESKLLSKIAKETMLFCLFNQIVSLITSQMSFGKFESLGIKSFCNLLVHLHQTFRLMKATSKIKISKDIFMILWFIQLVNYLMVLNPQLC